jgi:hypothetical protein
VKCAAVRSSSLSVASRLLAEALLDFEFKDTKGPRFVPVNSALDPTITGQESRQNSVSQDPQPSTPLAESAIEFRSVMPTLPPPMFSRQGAPHVFL